MPVFIKLLFFNMGVDCYLLFFQIVEVLKIANKYYNNNNNRVVQDDTQINEKIKVDEMMVIGPNGEKMGIKKLNDALTLAGYANLDLVLMNEKTTPAVAKIIDYNKYKYEKQKKMKDAQKKQRVSNKELKEYRLSVTIDIGDFNTRKKNAASYLEKGHKIKAFIRFKGRQMARPELGAEVLNKFAEALSDCADIEQKPKQEGRQMFMLLAPKK